MSDSMTPQPPTGYPEGYPPPGYPTQAPVPQYVIVPAVSREKSGSKGCMGEFIKGLTDALCCLLQSQNQDQDQGCCPCCCWPCGCDACCSPCGCCC